MNTQKWLTVLLGFVGVYIILRPDLSNLNYYSFFALLTCALWATGAILTKNLTNIQNPVLIVFCTNVIITALSAPLGAHALNQLTPHVLLLAIATAASAGLGYLFLTCAYKLTKVSNLLPHDYFRLILATITSYVFYNQSIDAYTIVGASVIFCSSLHLGMQQIKKSSKPKLSNTHSIQNT